MILTLEEITKKIEPVAKKYRLKAVYLFGSYARGDARDDSDIDILVDYDGSAITGLFSLGGLYNDLSDSVGKEIDMVTTQALEQENTKRTSPMFIDAVTTERVQIYG